MAAFINGLIGVPGRPVKLQMPDTIEKALNMAIIATNADKKDWASQREDRGLNRREFAVRGDREVTPLRNESRPRGKLQWRGTRGGANYGVGHNTRGKGVDGTHSRRTDSRTFMVQTTVHPIGGGAA